MNFKRFGRSLSEILNNYNVINDEIYLKLLENCFSTLSGSVEAHADGVLMGSKPDTIKKLYANLLSATVEFVRNGSNKDEVLAYLLNGVKLAQKRSEMYANLYGEHKTQIEVSLLNIGKHHPHIVDVDWTIDFIVKTSSLDEVEGPLFRISLITEKFNEMNKCKEVEHLNFTCNGQEMQDLVYKLKDAVKQCEHILSDPI